MNYKSKLLIFFSYAIILIAIFIISKINLNETIIENLENNKNTKCSSNETFFPTCKKINGRIKIVCGDNIVDDYGSPATHDNLNNCINNLKLHQDSDHPKYGGHCCPTGERFFHNFNDKNNTQNNNSQNNNSDDNDSHDNNSQNNTQNKNQQHIQEYNNHHIQHHNQEHMQEQNNNSQNNNSQNNNSDDNNPHDNNPHNNNINNIHNRQNRNSRQNMNDMSKELRQHISRLFDGYTSKLNNNPICHGNVGSNLNSSPHHQNNLANANLNSSLNNSSDANSPNRLINDNPYTGQQPSHNNSSDDTNDPRGYEFKPRMNFNR